MVRLMMVILAVSLTSCKATMTNIAMKTFKVDAGKKFPEVTLEDTAGNEIFSDSVFSSKVAFLNIWGTWCSPCLNEIGDLNAMIDRMEHNKNVSFINICAKSRREDWLKILDERKLQGENYFISDAEFDKMKSHIKAPLEGFPIHLIVSNDSKILGSNIGASLSEQPISVYILLEGQQGVYAHHAVKDFISMANSLNKDEKSDDSNRFIAIMREYFPETFESEEL